MAFRSYYVSVCRKVGSDWGAHRNSRSWIFIRWEQLHAPETSRDWIFSNKSPGSFGNKNTDKGCLGQKFELTASYMHYVSEDVKEQTFTPDLSKGRGMLMSWASPSIERKGHLSLLRLRGTWENTHNSLAIIQFFKDAGSAFFLHWHYHLQSIFVSEIGPERVIVYALVFAIHTEHALNGNATRWDEYYAWLHTKS